MEGSSRPRTSRQWAARRREARSAASGDTPFRLGGAATSGTDSGVSGTAALYAPFGAIGRFGNATIVTGAVHWAVLVPDSALVQDDLTGELRIARVLPDSVAVWTTVRLGPGQEGWHELLEPALPAGTPVVIRGQRGLPDSTHVTAGP